jgi:hypothetical protein
VSGAKVVLAMLGGTLAIALVAVAAFLLTDEGNLRCVEGELQDNAVRSDGTFEPRRETFATLEEAEAFVCKRVPHPRELGVLTLREVEVVRSTNLGSLIEGEGSATVSFVYESPGGPSPDLGVGVSFPPQGVPRVDAPSEMRTIAGHDALLITREGSTFVYWSTADFDFAAAIVDPSLSLDDLLAVLESVR